MNINFGSLSMVKFGNIGRGSASSSYQEILRTAELFLDFETNFNVDKVRLDDLTGDLLVMLAGDPAYQIIELRYKEDGSVFKEIWSSVPIFPPPPVVIEKVAPAGTISESVLQSVKEKVEAAKNMI